MAMEKERLVALVTKAQNGDGAATNELFNAFYNDIYYFALKTIKDDDLALDITQESFVEIITTIGNLKEPAAFVTWAKQITYHQCTRYFKKKKDVLVDEDEDGNTVFDDLKEENAEFIPDEALDQSDFKKTILAILDELSEEQRSAVMMYYFDEMSISQIAEIQCVSDGTVKSRLNYARKSIKASVEDYEKKNNIKLHAIPFFPFLKWIFDGSFGGGMPAASAKIVAEGVSAATGTTVTVSAATTTAATATAATATTVGIGAKIAALPLATKIIAGVVAAAITVGGTTTAVILSNDSDKKQPADTQSIVSTEDNVSLGDNTLEELTDELVLEGVIPEGCTYTLYDGTVLTAGQPFPEKCTAGDVVAYGDYLYGYECIYMWHEENSEKDWHLWKDGFDSGDSGVIESDVFDAWSVMVKDQTKSSYGEVVSKINGKSIKTLYATYYGCKNMTESPKIPSTITAMTASYYGCTSLKSTPIIPTNVERIMVAFRDCTSLTGDVKINATLDKSLEWFYVDVFSGTKGTINLVGTTPEDDLILIAKASDNRNITVNGKTVDYDNVSVDEDNSQENENSDDTNKDVVEDVACAHDTVETIFDNIMFTWSHTGRCTDCGALVYENSACVDKDKNNQCDLCGVKINFVTAFNAINFDFDWPTLNDSRGYGFEPSLPAETVLMEAVMNSNCIDIQYEEFGEWYIHSAEEVERNAKLIFDIDDTKIAEMKTLQQTVDGQKVSVYDSASNTYKYFHGAYGGGSVDWPIKMGYEKISDTKYVAYLNTRSYNGIYYVALNCTYINNTVKVTGIFLAEELPSNILPL